MELPKAYEPGKYEQDIYKRWEESGLFNPDVCVDKGVTKENAEPFSIVLPPPNVTGTLHMGHAAMLAIEDVMIRYHRMKGDRTLWIPGTDHAAVATESKVESKLIKEKGMKNPKKELGREKFLDEVKKFAQDSHDTIVNQSKRMGASLDWSREAYTLDDKRNLAVRTVFKKMYDDGLIYRGYRVVNWSVKGQSTCSDDELVYVDRPGKLYYFTYSKDFPITIATTRPETKLGDTAVAVHPKGKWKKFIGKEFDIADFGQKGHSLHIKVIGDDTVDDAFGTGALGVTTAHSATDFEMYQKQKAAGNDIGLIPIIGEDGKMLPAAGSEYAGLSVKEAREKVVEWLHSEGLLEKEEDITQSVGTSDRFGDVVEPLPKTQWFIDVNKKIPGCKKSLKELMLDAVRKDGIKILPERFEKIYFHWIENLRDWNISRQIWFGHRIPVWYKQPAKPVEIVFIRHGATEANERAVGTGQSDSPLTEQGKKNLSQLGASLPSEIKAVYSSDLGRAVESAKIVFEENNIIADARLREIDFGKLTGKSLTAIHEAAGEYEGGETYADMRSRMEAFLADVVDKHAGQRVAIVGHSGTGNMLRHIIQGAPMEYDVTSAAQPQSAFEIFTVKTLQHCALETPKGDGWEQDPDTLDTWFSSGLWTFSALGWPNEDEWKKNKVFHPTAVLETGYDIIFFWVARMILMTTYTLGEIPFKTVYLHGLVRDEQGRKMSKSLGNIIDPLEMCDKYGTDATRLSLLIGGGPGNDMKLSEEKIGGFRNFANKLWNIARFITTQVTINNEQLTTPKPVTLADKWVLHRLNEIVARITVNIEKYNFSYAGEELRDFTWGELADWYLEIAKIEGEKSEILNFTLNTILKLWHPYMPYVTEAIWKEVYGGTEMLMVASWPEVKHVADAKAVEEFEVVRSLITGIRSLRAENKIEPVKLLKAHIGAGKHVKLLEENAEVIKKLARLENLTIDTKVEKPKTAIGFVESGIEVFIDLGGVVDVAKEKSRLEKELAEVEKYVTVQEAKLNNSDFVGRAPAAVVEGEKKKLNEAKEKQAKLNEQLSHLV